MNSPTFSSDFYPQINVSGHGNESRGMVSCSAQSLLAPLVDCNFDVSISCSDVSSEYGDAWFVET